MLARRLVPLGRAMARPSPVAARRRPGVAALARRTALTDAERAEIEDPEMNGGYENPPRISRQHRDPYGDWWDPQERRNFGEPVHEDNDMLGILSLEDDTHFSPGRAAACFAVAVALFLGVAGATRLVYPDKVAAPRTFPGGLDRELGGFGSLPARKEGEDEW